MKIKNKDPKLVLVNTEDGDTQWQLEGDYFFHWEFDGSWYRFMIPDGFPSDGASVPRWLRWLAGRGRFGKLAPLVHDYLHAREGFVKVKQLEHPFFGPDPWLPISPSFFTRKEADKLFFRIMSDQGVKPRWLRRGAYKAVRAWSVLQGDRW